MAEGKFSILILLVIAVYSRATLVSINFSISVSNNLLIWTSCEIEGCIRFVHNLETVMSVKPISVASQ